MIPRFCRQGQDIGKRGMTMIIWMMMIILMMMMMMMMNERTWIDLGSRWCLKSYFFSFYPTLPYPTLPYPTLPYPTLPYLEEDLEHGKTKSLTCARGEL